MVSPVYADAVRFRIIEADGVREPLDFWWALGVGLGSLLQRDGEVRCMADDLKERGSEQEAVARNAYTARQAEIHEQFTRAGAGDLDTHGLLRPVVVGARAGERLAVLREEYGGEPNPDVGTQKDCCAD